MGIISSLISGAASIGQTALSNAANAEQAEINRIFQSSEADKGNAFSAEQAAIARQFNAAEAQKGREWQESFYQMYQSPAALMKQYEESGLNPALMYEGAGSGSPVSNAGASGPAAAAAGIPSGSFARMNPFNFLETALASAKAITDLKNQQTLINAQVENIHADTANKEQNTITQASQAALNEAMIGLTEANTTSVIKSYAIIENQVAQGNLDIQLKAQGLERGDVEIGIAYMKFVQEQSNAYYADRLNYAQERMLKAQQSLFSAQSELASSEASLTEDKRAEIRARVSKLEQEVSQQSDYFIRDMLLAEQEIRKAKGDADFANGIGKRYNKELTYKYVSDGVKALSLVSAAALAKPGTKIQQTSSPLLVPNGMNIDPSGKVTTSWHRP